MVVAGYSSGGVRFFHAGNGTELGSADTGSGAVLAVKRGGQVNAKPRAGFVCLPVERWLKRAGEACWDAGMGSCEIM